MFIGRLDVSRLERIPREITLGFSQKVESIESVVVFSVKTLVFLTLVDVEGLP